METRETAEAFTALLKAVKFDEAAMRFWSEDEATDEAAAGDLAEALGREANFAQAQWWYANPMVHDTQVEGPWVNADRFLCRMMIDVTPKGGARMTVEELALHTVRDGKVAEERDFY